MIDGSTFTPVEESYHVDIRSIFLVGEIFCPMNLVMKK